MANRYTNPWAGLPQIGARIGGAIQQKGERKWLTALQQLRQEEGRRYQESTPQWQSALLELAEQKKTIQHRMDFTKGLQSLDEMIRQARETGDEITSQEAQKIEEQISGIAGEAYPQVRDRWQKYYSDYQQGQIATEERGLKRRKTKLEIGKLERQPGEKEITPTGQFKVQSELHDIFVGKPEMRDERKGITWEAELGLVEKILGIPYEALMTPIPGVRGPRMAETPGIKAKMWQAWNSLKAIKAPIVQRAGDKWMQSHFGPDPTKEMGIGLKGMNLGNLRKQLEAYYGRDKLEKMFRGGAQKGYSREALILQLSKEMGLK